MVDKSANFSFKADISEDRQPNFLWRRKRILACQVITLLFGIKYKLDIVETSYTNKNGQITKT